MLSYTMQTIGLWQASYTLNMGQAVNANPGNGLWRIISDKDISAYSGGGYGGIYAYAAEFAPLAFNTFHLFSLKKVDVNEPNSVIPGDYITYEITYGPNGVDHNNVVITDYLPYEVDYENFDPNYNPDKHTYTWQIGSLAANDPNKSVTLTVKVNKGAAPLGKITNYCEIESDTAYKTAIAYTNVGSWEPNSQIIYVDRLSPCAPGTGMSWRFAYRDLQDALERARAGCGSEIWVAAGTYKPTQNPADTDANFALVNGVSLYGGFPTGGGLRNWMTNQTILDGNLGEYRVNYVVQAQDVNEATILDGFTIIKGSEIGIYCNGGSPTIANNIIQQSAWGIGCENNSSPVIKACWIQDNVYGIGYANSVLTVTDCIIANNNPGYGIYGDVNYGLNSQLTVTNSIIRFNGYNGIYLINMLSTTIKNNWIHNNLSDGIYITGQSGQSLVRNNTIVHNASYGIYRDYSAPEPNISNCIIWGNETGQLDGCTATYSWTTDDPCFFNPNDPNDYHLDPNSPCIDKGDPNADYNGETDIDGEGRVKYVYVDIGADEYYWSPADFNNPDSRDGLVNFIDYAIFANAWDSNTSDSDWNHDYDLAADGVINYYDLDLFCEDWLWQAGWTKTFTCGAGQGMGQTMTAALASQEAAGEVSYPPVLAEQQIEQVEPLKIEQLIKWLEELWLDEETQKLIDEDVWLKFMESLKEEQ